jgi:hypothetical protein
MKIRKMDGVLKPGKHLHKWARIYTVADHLEKFINFMQALPTL